MKPTAKTLSKNPKNISSYMGQKFHFDSSIEMDESGSVFCQICLYNEQALVVRSSMLNMPHIVRTSMREGAKNDGAQRIFGGMLSVTMSEELWKQLNIKNRNCVIPMNSSVKAPEYKK